MGKRYMFKIREITVAELVEEGVTEVGAATGTSIVFVRTERGLHLFHGPSLPDRKLDAYGLELAKRWLDAGHSAFETASNLGISMPTLAQELEAAGFERRSMNDGGPRKGRTKRYKSRGRSFVQKNSAVSMFAHRTGAYV